MTNLAAGIDIADHQRAIKDYARVVREQVPGAPLEFAYVKASEAQGWKDPSYERHVDALLEQGLLVGAYHFGYADRFGRGQARFFAPLAMRAPAKPMLDLEGRYNASTKLIEDVPAVGPKAALRAYRELVEETEQLTGRESIVYTGPGFIATFFSDPEVRYSDDARFLAARLLHVAHYGVAEPLVPLFWRDAGATWLVHQYSGTGDLVGGGKVDLNWCRDVRALDPHRDTVPGGIVVPTLEAERPFEGPIECDSAAECLALVQRPGGQAEQDLAEELVEGILGAWNTLPASPTPTRPETPNSKREDS